MSSSSPNPRVPEHAVPDALERTFAEQRAPLVRYATRLLGDRERAEDVVQDTFMRLMSQRTEAVGGHEVEWLFTVCRNRSLDVLRKENRMKRFEEGEVERVTAAEPRPGRSLEEEEMHETLVRLIEGLPPSQQEVIRLKFQNGFSYQEIARITEKSIGNVGFLIHTAVARLRTGFMAQRP
jgi:RNA polymerase sigma-70 factor (ECF subfamily)